MDEDQDAKPFRIPVFSSVPSRLEPTQEASKRYIYWHLRRLQIEPQTVGATIHPHFNPLHEVRTLARHCAGGIILGYHQLSAKLAMRRGERIRNYVAPTEWNNLETGILFGLSLPLLVLREPDIHGGIFDEGASDVFVQDMPMPDANWSPTGDVTGPGSFVDMRFEQAALRWQAMVRETYYHGDEPSR